MQRNHSKLILLIHIRTIINKDFGGFLAAFTGSIMQEFYKILRSNNIGTFFDK